MTVFTLHGVHGGGKTFISKPVAEDLGVEFVEVDAVNRFEDIPGLDPFFRQKLYAHNALAGYAYVLGQPSKNFFLDFGPRQVLPYTEWFLGRNNQEIVEYINHSIKRLEEKTKTIIVNIFFVIDKNPDIVLQRIARRQRENLLHEERNREYLLFIDTRMKEIAKRLEENGAIVEYIPADGSVAHKVKKLWEIAVEYL